MNQSYAMNAVSRLAPSATKMIRADHTKVVATFHRYQQDTSPDKKRAIANTVCLDVEIHAQLEEEIFYPAMRSVDTREITRSIPEHDEIKRLISVVRNMDVTEAAFDETFMTLMREIMNHVAHEETVLLPEAERSLGEQRLSELGAAMTKRRLELTAPNAGEMVANTARSFSGAMVAGAGVLVVGALLARRAYSSSRTFRS